MSKSNSPYPPEFRKQMVDLVRAGRMNCTDFTGGSTI